MAIVAEVHCGDRETAGSLLDTALRRFPGMVLFDSARAILAAVRRDERAVRRAIESTEKRRKEFAHFHHAQFDVACALATLGFGDEAMRWLGDAVRGGFPCLPAVENEPLLESLRGHSEYGSVIAELRRTRDHFAGVFESLRANLNSSS